MRSVVFLTPLLLLALSAVAESPYKIGVLAPLTGDMQIFGQKAIEGVQLALDGYPGGVSYVVENVGTGATVEVAKGTTKLLSVDKVDVVFGAFFLDQTMVAAPLTEQAGRVLVSQTLCSPELVRFKRVFCGYPSTAEQLASFGKLVAKLKLKSAALVVENSSYGLDTERETRRIFSDQGVAVSYYQTVNPQDRDFKTVIAKLKRSKPDAVVAVAADPAQGFTFFK